MSQFPGFPAETFAFLDGIAAHNEKAWFDANRGLYDAGYVEPAKQLVTVLGPLLRGVSPEVQFEPKVNGSISRINRDIRFSKDKRPYKDHLDLWFWHGDKRGWNTPGFWFRLTAGQVYLGSGMHGFDKDMLESFRQAVIHPRSGKALLKAVETIRATGDYAFGEKTRKQPPRGFEADADRAEYLLFEGLHAGTEMPASEARKPGFAALCAKHFANTWPVSQWLLDEVVG